MPSRRPRFSAVLDRYIKGSVHSLKQLTLKTGVSPRTLANWRAGLVSNPSRSLMALLKLADALGLSVLEANEFLQAAGCPSLDEILDRAERDRDESRLKLFTRWRDDIHRLRHAPFQADQDLPNFVGRVKELDALMQELTRLDQSRVYCIWGPPGVGKTALAAHLAHRLRAHFPDGILWARVDTTGTDSCLAAFIAPFGINLEGYPDPEIRRRAVRDLLRAKRVLIVLDNAEKDAQIAPLLPALPAPCAVIVTTRRRDLWCLREARDVPLAPFDKRRKEALKLLEQVVGKARVRKEKAALEEIADLLGHLPLAVDIAANRLKHEAHLTAAIFLARIKKKDRRLSELNYGERGIRFLLNTSYQDLTAREKTFFANLALFDGEDFGMEASASVSAVSEDEAHQHLARLASLSLVYAAKNNRYRLHPLVRDYAREQLTETGAPMRLVEYFAQFVEKHRLAFQAVEVESGNIRGALVAAFQRRAFDHFIRGVNAFHFCLESKGLYEEAERILQQAEQCARVSSNQVGLSHTLMRFGALAGRRGEFAEAESRFRDALSIARALNDEQLVSAALRGLGAVIANRGRYADAEALFREGLELAKKMDSQTASARFSRTWAYCQTIAGTMRARKNI